MLPLLVSIHARSIRPALFLRAHHPKFRPALLLHAIVLTCGTLLYCVVSFALALYYPISCLGETRNKPLPSRLLGAYLMAGRIVGAVGVVTSTFC